VKPYIATLHSLGMFVVCYVDVGSYENYRDDASSIPKSVIGSPYSGYPNEWWLNTNSPIVRTIMETRFDRALASGCDAIEPDNIGGYEEDTGFNLTAADSANYNTFLALQAHNRGMGIALKNDGDQAQQMQPFFDFVIAEQCVQYGGCHQCDSFLNNNKAVFDAEYAESLTAMCNYALTDPRISYIKKPLDLDNGRQSCNASATSVGYTCRLYDSVTGTLIRAIYPGNSSGTSLPTSSPSVTPGPSPSSSSGPTPGPTRKPTPRRPTHRPTRRPTRRPTHRPTPRTG